MDDKRIAPNLSRLLANIIHNDEHLLLAGETTICDGELLIESVLSKHKTVVSAHYNSSSPELKNKDVFYVVKLALIQGGVHCSLQNKVFLLVLDDASLY